MRDTGPPAAGGDEKATLLEFLGYLRESVVKNVIGVPEPQVRTAGVPSGTSLLGLVRHLTYVERFYFLGEPITGLRRTFRPTATETVDGLVAAYREAIARADEIAAECTDLTRPIRSGGPSARWVLVHLIEETGRHAGHADILREQIDGATGR